MCACIIESYPPVKQLDQENEIQGKFVQLFWQGKEYLLFSAKSLHRFHNQMLAYFLADHGVPHRWVDEKTLYVDPREVGVTGSGHFRLVKSDNVLEIWGDKSRGFDRFKEAGIRSKIHGSGHPWSEAKVLIH